MTLFQIKKIQTNLYSVPVQDEIFLDFLSMFNIEFKKQEQLHIQCKSIVFLKDFLLNFQDNQLSYEFVYAFSQNIVSQLLYLEKRNKTVSAFSLQDFVVIDESYLVYCNFSKIYSIKNDHITIFDPYFKNDNHFFLTSEMVNNSSLPLKLNYKNIYISLAYLIVFLFYGKYKYEKKENLTLMSNLLGTKLYYFVNNCLEENVQNRHICFF